MKTSKSRRATRKGYLKVTFCSSIIAGVDFADDRPLALNAGRPPIYQLCDGREPFLAMQLADLDLLDLTDLPPPWDTDPTDAEQLSLLNFMQMLATEADLDNGVPLLLVRQDGVDGLLLAFDRRDWGDVVAHREAIRSMAEGHERRAERERRPLLGGERGVSGVILI